MHAFKAFEEGYLSWLEPWERLALEDLARELDQVLGGRGGASGAHQRPPGAGGPGERHVPGTARLPLGVREGESLADARTLAALDFDPSLAPGPDGAGPQDQALAVLLPVSSHDPELEEELAALTREPLRQAKTKRLGRVLAELVEPSGPQGQVLVRRVELADWLGAINDLRVLLSHRLGITSARQAEQVHQDVLAPPPQGASGAQRLRHTRSVLYEVLTWWQESLLSAVEEDQGRA